MTTTERFQGSGFAEWNPFRAGLPRLTPRAGLPNRIGYRSWIAALALGLLWMPEARAAVRLRVGVYQNSPKVAVSESGRAEGIFIDLIEAIAAEEGWSIEYVPGTWAEGLDRLAASEIDLLPDVARMQAREAVYRFHREPVLSDWFQVYTRHGSGIRSLLDLKDRRVSLLERSIQQDAFERTVVGFDLNVTLAAMPDYGTAFAAVMRGEADAVIANRFFGTAHMREYQLEDTAIIFNPTQLFFAAPMTGDPALLEAIDRNLKRFKMDPASVFYRSLQRWTSEPVGLKVPAWIRVAGIVAAGLVVFGLVWSVALKREVAARTRELALRNEQIVLTEKALRESELKYRELVELANSIILRWTHDGRITFLNEYGLRFFGYSSDEIIGRHVMGTIVSETDQSGRDLRQLMDRICADPRSFERNVNENMRRNGERVWIAWTNRVVRDAQGQVAGILSVGSDITELKRAEASIRELNAGLERRVAERTAELAVARDRAEGADRLKSAFLATMSHELRTPMNSIIGFTGILLQELAGPLNPEQRKQLVMVRDSARHLLALINDVLDISKIEAGQLVVLREPFDLRASLVKVAGLVRPLAERKRLALEMKLAPEIGMLVSDARRVEQVLLNLLSNAIKFTERGAVTLAAGLEPGDGDPGATGRLCISVADTGIGIKPDDLCELFEPFRQIDSGLTRQHEGTGLGLAICRRLAELLGGHVSAVSEWGKGSVFTLTLNMKDQGTS